MSLDESVTQLTRKVLSLQDNLQHLIWSIKTPEDTKVDPPRPAPPDSNHNLVNTLYDRAMDLSNQARPCEDLAIQLEQETRAGKNKQKLSELSSQLHTRVKATRDALQASPGLPEQREELKKKGEEDPAWLPWTAGVEDAIQSCQRAVEGVRSELLDVLHDVAMAGYVSEPVTPSPQPQTAPAAAGTAPETAACPTTSPTSDQPDTCPADDNDEVSKEPVEVKPEPCYGTVRVHVAANGQGVPDVKVRLRGKEEDNLEFTKGDGQIEWTNVETGSYVVILSVPDDYDLDDVLVNTISTDDDEPHVEIQVGDGTTTEVEFQLTSHGAEIRGRILEHRGGCDHPLSGVKITVSSRKDSACVTTERDGTFKYMADAPRLYEVKVDPSVETEGSCGIPLSPANPTTLLIQTEAGQCYDVGDIRYVAVKGQITVGAVADAADDDQQIPLDGLTFVLRADGEDGPGTRLSGEGEQYVTFSNLAAGRYSVSVSGTPIKTKSPLRLSADPGGSVSVLVTPGKTFNLRQYFRFEPAVAEVQGSVVDHESEGPLAGVPVFLEPKGQDFSPLESRTDQQGIFTFPDVPPGPFRVTLASKTTAIGSQKWVLPPGAKGALEGYVKSGEKLALPALRLVRDRHQIIAVLQDESGSGIANAALKIEDADGNLIANVVTGEDGQVTYDVDREGTYYIVPVLESGEHLRRYVAEVHSTATVKMVSGGRARGAQQQSAAAAKNISQAFSDATTFPLLMESVNLPSAPSFGGAPQAGDAGSWSRLVEGTLKEVLGWRPKKDPNGVVAALTQSFSPTEAGGFTEWKWNPRTYTVQVQADMGAVTGAQASIYSRAKTSLDAAQPLLDGLAPLIPDADLEDIEASRSIVRSQLQELIRELGTEGGPRPSRIDQLFELLSGPRAAKGQLLPIVFDPDVVPGQLGTLRDRFGMLRKNVNTIDEEQNLTNFVILVDYVQTLRQSWESQRSFFDRLPHVGQQPYLGTQLVLVSRALSVVAESVAEVGFTMDSVFLGPAERATIRIDLGAGESPLFVSELLGWIEQFTSEEAPRLISDSGKDGVEAIKTTLANLSRFTRLATSQTAVPAAFNTTRVQRAWIELADQIDGVSNLIIDIKR